MNKILVITNDSNESQLIKHAYQFTSANGSKLTVGRYQSQIRRKDAVLVLAGANAMGERAVGNDSQALKVNTININSLTILDLSSYIWRNGFELVIIQHNSIKIDMQALANHLHCPLLLLPADLSELKTDRIVYLTDLRYCQQAILSSVSKLNRDSVLVAHITQQGLPEIDTNYSTSLFSDASRAYQGKPELYFSHIKEKNFTKITDTLINTMQASMLICQNRQYHYTQLTNGGLTNKLPAHITVPLLIFPC